MQFWWSFFIMVEEYGDSTIHVPKIYKNITNTICIYKIVQLYSLHLCSIAALRVFFGLKYKCYWYNTTYKIVQ